ncbi:MAG: EAL domain-containing protein [Ardenticatenales bacterium]|nr:EAL domain-containing protein [Ardenticatenales bacterium]
MRFWTKSLMARLVSYFLLLSLLTVCLLGTVAYVRAIQAITQLVFDRLSVAATLKAEELNRWVGDQSQEVLFIARRPEVRDPIRVMLSHPKDGPTYETAYAELSSYLTSIVASRPDLGEITILDNEGGQILISTDKSHEGQYRVRDSYFVEGRWRTFVQNVYHSPITNRPTLTIATPLLDESGQRLGALLAAHLNLERMDRIILEDPQLGINGETYLVDELNAFVSSARFGRDAFPRGVRSLGIDEALRGNSGSALYENYAGVPVLGVYRWMEERELALLTELPQAEAFEPARDLARTLFLTGLLSAGVLAAGVFLLARQIARPLLAITQTATQVAAGDLSLSAPVLTDDEIGVLARAFNQMTAQLRLLYEALRRSEEHFRSLIENASDIITTLDAKGIIRYVSPSTNRMLGYKPESLRGQSAFDFIHPDDLPIVIQAFSRMSQRRTPRQPLLEFRFRHANGSWRILEASRNNIVDDFEIIGVINARDITERKEAETEREHLLAAEREQRLLAETLREVASALNSHLERERVLKLMLEYLERVVEYDSVSIMLINGDELEIVAQRGYRVKTHRLLRLKVGALGHVQQVLQGRAPVIIKETLDDPRWLRLPGEEDSYIRCWLGVPLIAYNQVIGLLNLDKETPGYYTTRHAEFAVAFANQAATAIENARLYTEAQQELQERKRAEAALRASEERYALAARGANDGLWDWNLMTGAVYFSARWQAMLGVMEDRRFFSMSDWFDRVHPEELTLLEAELSAHLDGRSPHFEHEHRMRHENGSYLWMLTRGIAVRDEQGQVYRMAGSQTDITERKRAEEQLLRNAFYDSLTGLPNRALFMDRLGRLIERTRRHEEELFAVLFLDIDRFKNINDSLGHMEGDQLLVSIAARLACCLRPTDTLARLGGDEFALLLEEIKDVSDATRMAERIQEELALPFMLTDQELFITASIGITLSSTGYERPEDLLRDADTAMYRAKGMGKARHVVFDTAMHVRAVRLLQLETELRRALEREEFRVYYQPIVSLKTGHIIGAEALVRWAHPQRGIVSPAEFMPLIEENGLIQPIGEWVLRTACAQNRWWQMAGFPPLGVAVNLSAQQFRQKALCHLISDVLSETGLAANSLKLELTESIVMENAETTILALQELKEIGVELSIDDFGTGYSSLSYLKRFPIDTLKVDRSFVRDITTDPNDAAITIAIVTLAHSLKLKVISEGVETEEQLAFLRAQRCDEIQGYLFSPPIPADAFTRLLQEGRCLETMEAV